MNANQKLAIHASNAMEYEPWMTRTSMNQRFTRLPECAVPAGKANPRRVVFFPRFLFRSRGESALAE